MKSSQLCKDWHIQYSWVTRSKFHIHKPIWGEKILFKKQNMSLCITYPKSLPGHKVRQSFRHSWDRIGGNRWYYYDCLKPGLNPPGLIHLGLFSASFLFVISSSSESILRRQAGRRSCHHTTHVAPELPTQSPGWARWKEGCSGV